MVCLNECKNIAKKSRLFILLKYIDFHIKTRVRRRVFFAVRQRLPSEPGKVDPRPARNEVYLKDMHKESQALAKGVVCIKKIKLPCRQKLLS